MGAWLALNQFKYFESKIKGFMELVQLQNF